MGKPVVIEETFPLECTVEELEAFLRSSRDIAFGWLRHYDGATVEDYDPIEREGKLNAPQAICRQALRSFILRVQRAAQGVVSVFRSRSSAHTLFRARRVRRPYHPHVVLASGV